MPTVIFSHTKTQEKEYLNQLLKEKKWFERKNFPAFLPKNKKGIENEIGRKNEPLNKKIIWLRKKWGKIEKDYFQIIEGLQYRKPLSNYKFHASRFGPEGKYGPSNLLFVRLRIKKDERRAVETIGHELLHLLFSDLFNSKKLNYAEREGMVDALILETDLRKLFPKYERQSIGKMRRSLLKSILHKN